MNGPGLFRRAVMCPLGLCNTFRFAEDDVGCWGECSKCGKRSGYITRAQIRAYMDREEALERAGAPK